MEIKKFIRSIPDYPKKGILFRDITTLINNEKAFAESIDQIIEKSKSRDHTENMLAQNKRVIQINKKAGLINIIGKKYLDPNIFYTGIDTHAPFLNWGGEIYGISENCNFVHGDAMKLPFKDKSFEITIVNLFHFFENIRVCQNRCSCSNDYHFQNSNI